MAVEPVDGLPGVGMTLSPPKRQVLTREALRDLNAQDWADFKAHWPMRVLSVVADVGIGTLLGVGLGLALTVYGLQLLGA